MWRESQALQVTPSSLLGLTDGSYEAFCLNQAVWAFGSKIDSEVEKAGHKKQKGEGALISARKRVLDRYLKGSGSSSKGQYRDPATLKNGSE